MHVVGGKLGRMEGDEEEGKSTISLGAIIEVLFYGIEF